MMSSRITIILADDHAIVRAGFRMLLATEESIGIIGEAANGETACQLYFDLQPDVLVLDLSMPGFGGLECIRRIISRDSEARILVLSVHDEFVFVDRAINAGAKAYISKLAHPEVLITAIHKVARGEVYIEPGLVVRETDDYRSLIESLSPREFDIFLLLAKGFTAHKIAVELSLGYKTIANYSTQIKTKLQVSTVAELVYISIALGLMKN